MENAVLLQSLTACLNQCCSEWEVISFGFNSDKFTENLFLN